MIVRYVGRVALEPEKPSQNGKLSRIEWFAILGLAISAGSLAINLYRMRHAK